MEVENGKDTGDLWTVHPKVPLLKPTTRIPTRFFYGYGQECYVQHQILEAFPQGSGGMYSGELDLSNCHRPISINSSWGWLLLLLLL